MMDGWDQRYLSLDLNKADCDQKKAASITRD